MKRILSLSILAALAVLVLFVGCQPKGDIKIGAILPLSGDAASYGESAKKGLELAVTQVNEGGGINGRRVAVIYEDDQAVPEKGVAAFKKLSEVDKVPAVIGAMASSVTLAIAPLAEKAKVVVLSQASSAPSITDAGDYIFRNEVSDYYDGAFMADAAWNKLGLKKVAVLYINNDMGVGVKDVFLQKYKAFGGEVSDVEGFEQGATDSRTQLAKIKQSKPDAVFMTGHKELIQLLNQYKELGIKAHILSNAMLEDPDVLAKAKAAAEGAIYSYRAYDPSSKDKTTSDFVAAFNKKWGAAPDYWAAQSYDAAKLLLLAMSSSGTSAEAVKKGLYAIKDYAGVTGLTSFDSNGDVIKKLMLKTIRGGSFVPYQ